MTATPNGRAAPAPDEPRPDASREAKRLAAAILEVLAGLRTPAQAAEATEVSLPRYYQLEARALVGLVRACERQPRGRRRETTAAAALAKENERLKRELGRQQTLVRLAQRSVGLGPPPAAKGRRKRRPTKRALVAAQRLRAEADRVDEDPAATERP